MTAADTVSRIYQAFGDGDVATILGYLDDNVTWDADWADNSAQRAGVANLTPRRGRDGVAEFFALVGKTTIHEFVVHDLMSSDRQVVVQVTIDTTVLSGGRLRDEELHLWTFGPDGRVVALRHYVDTAKHIRAEAGEDTTVRAT